MKFVPREPIDFKPVVRDKRGGVHGDAAAEQPNGAQGESGNRSTDAARPSAPSTPPFEGSVADAEREGSSAAPPPEEVLEAIKAVDFLKLHDQFVVRDVTYRVVSILKAQNALLIAPVEIGRATMKQMRKAGRKAGK